MSPTQTHRGAKRLGPLVLEPVWPMEFLPTGLGFQRTTTHGVDWLGVLLDGGSKSSEPSHAQTA